MLLSQFLKPLLTPVKLAETHTSQYLIKSVVKPGVMSQFISLLWHPTLSVTPISGDSVYISQSSASIHCQLFYCLDAWLSSNIPSDFLLPTLPASDAHPRLVSRRTFLPSVPDLDFCLSVSQTWFPSYQLIACHWPTYCSLHISTGLLPIGRGFLPLLSPDLDPGQGCTTTCSWGCWA